MIDVIPKEPIEPTCLRCGAPNKKSMRTAMMECTIHKSSAVFHLCDMCIETIHRQYVLHLKECVDAIQSQ